MPNILRWKLKLPPAQPVVSYLDFAPNFRDPDWLESGMYMIEALTAQRVRLNFVA